MPIMHGARSDTSRFWRLPPPLPVCSPAFALYCTSLVLLIIGFWIVWVSKDPSGVQPGDDDDVAAVNDAAVNDAAVNNGASPYPTAAAANPFPDTAVSAQPQLLVPNPAFSSQPPLYDTNPFPAGPEIPPIATELGLSLVDLAAYKHLWETVQSDDRLPAGAALKFFGKSGIDEKKVGTLRTMWGLVDTELPKGSLNQDEFIRACKLVAQVQAGQTMSVATLAVATPLPIFEGIDQPDLVIHNSEC